MDMVRYRAHEYAHGTYHRALVNAALGLCTILSGYNGGCIDIDIEIFRKLLIDIDRNIRIPHRNSTTENTERIENTQKQFVRKKRTDPS